jgi:quinol---cytochrome c reductase cytochrome c subunit, bacillus type
MAVTARKVINRRVRYETELSAQKKEGHPFFPYAMFHDTVVNFIIVLMIVAMATVWHATAGPVDAHHPQGQNGVLGALYEGKANPAVAVTEPRPEWYFLFLFELLRIFKSPWELIFATIIIPTILMVLLIVWPFLDRGRDRRISRRPVGMAFGLSVPAVLIALTIAGGVAPGAVTGSNITGDPAFDSLPAATLISTHGCVTCHNFGAGGGNIGPDLSHGAPNPSKAAIQAQIENGGNGMPPFKDAFTPQEIQQLVDFIDGLRTGTPPSS